MSFLYLDQALLAVPNFAIDDKSSAIIFDRLVHFSKVALQPETFKLLLAHNCSDQLWEKNIGPDYDGISQFIELMNLGDYFSARDLLSAYNTIFERCEFAIDIAGLEVKQFSDFDSDPVIPVSLSPVALVNETKRAMLDVVLLNSVGQGCYLVSGFGDPGRLIFSVKSSDVICLQSDGSVKSVSTVVGDVVSCSSIQDLANIEESLFRWRSAKSAADLSTSIALGVIAAVGINDIEQHHLNFCIGPQFLERLEAHQCAGYGKFASAAHSLCIQIMAGTCRRPVNPFGKPNQIFRSFDGAGGFRVHLTKDKLGLRLMFWNSASGIEFANVGVKQELEIVTGGKGAAEECRFFDLIG